MAVTYQTPAPASISGTEAAGVVTYTGLTIDAAWELVHIFAYIPAISGSSAILMSSASMTDGVNTLTLAVADTNFEVLSLPTAQAYGNGVAYGVLANATPGALSTGAGAVTLTVTWSRDAASSGTCIFGGLNIGSTLSPPLREVAYVSTGDASAASLAHSGMVVEQDGCAVLYEWDSGAFTFDGTTISPLTERYDAALSSRRYGIATLDIASNQTITPTVTPSSSTKIFSYLLWFKESNDADADTAATAPFVPGDTVTLTGISMNASGAGARVRKVGGTASFDELTSYTPTSTTATAVIPNRPTKVPYTSTSHTVEFISTKTGPVISGSATPAYTFNPPSGYSVVEITTPDLTSNSLLSYLGWTSIAGDQIEWDNTVAPSGVTVTVTVNPDGTVLLDSGVNPMPSSVTFSWRAYSTGDEAWTGSASNQSDWATATLTDGSLGGGTGTGLTLTLNLRT